MKVYVNWNTREILNTKEYEKHIQEIIKNEIEDEDQLIDYVESNYYASEIFGKLLREECSAEQLIAEIKEEYAKDIEERVLETDNYWKKEITED